MIDDRLKTVIFVPLRLDFTLKWAVLQVPNDTEK